MRINEFSTYYYCKTTWFGLALLISSNLCFHTAVPYFHFIIFKIHRLYDADEIFYAQNNTAEKCGGSPFLQLQLVALCLQNCLSAKFPKFPTDVSAWCMYYVHTYIVHTLYGYICSSCMPTQCWMLAVRIVELVGCQKISVEPSSRNEFISGPDYSAWLSMKGGRFDGTNFLSC